MTSPSLEQTAEFSRFAAALAGQYELECEIGRGGMGVVYRARDLRLDRRVAIKTLPPHLANDAVVRERFLREARTAGALSHQHIVPIHRADELGGQVFFVMGYVDGESMAQRIRERGRLDPREVVRELSDVADALSYAHSRGVVHRDVKAENILLDAATGRALVTDFGIARLAEAAPLTATGQVLGTVYYLSPEQVSGEAVDFRSDIYSLGVVGFFALAGRFPFNAELASAVLIAHVTKTPPPLHTLAPDTPRVLADIIDRCLAKDPAARFQTCAEVLDALDAIRDTVEAQMRDVDRVAPSVPALPLVSDTEAQAILGRAADLQAMTGMQPQVSAAPAQRDAERDAARTSGFKPLDLRDAAVEAGISAKYVDRALAERGLSGAALPDIVINDHSSKRNELIGGRTRLEYEVIVDGEMPSDDYDLLVDVIRRKTGEAGTVGAVGRSFTWYTGQGRRNLQVTVFPRGGKTTIRVSDGMKAVVGGLFGGIMGGYGGGTTGVWIGIGAANHNMILGGVLWVANALTAYFVARGIFSARNTTRQKDLRELAEALGSQARQSIDHAKPKLPPGSGRQLR